MLSQDEAQAQSGTLIEFGPFTFDKALGKLSKHGTPLRLRGMPLKILQHLLERPGEVVSRGELQRMLWRDTAFGDFEQGLNTAVNVVRKTLGDSADQARYLETVPGQGYRFIAPIRSTAAARETNLPTERLDPASMVRHQNQSKPPMLIFGAVPSPNCDANDQYNLAMNFLSFQNDIPLALKTFERAFELDPHFASARLQRAMLRVIEIYNGYANDEGILLETEEDLHQAERELPATDGLLLAAQACAYLAGRLDRVPMAKLEGWWRECGSKGEGSPVYLVIPRMLEGQTREPIAILRMDLEHNPLANPTRMLLGESLRIQGETEEAIRTLERVLQQGPTHPTPAWILTMAYLDAGKPEQAAALMERMRPEFEKNYMWRHAWAIVLAVEGKHTEAVEAMNEGTLKFARVTWTVTSATADFYALPNEPSKAIEWLQLAVSRGDERVSYFRHNPRLATLRDDPRFQSLLRSLEARRKKPRRKR